MLLLHQGRDQLVLSVTCPSGLPRYSTTSPTLDLQLYGAFHNGLIASRQTRPCHIRRLSRILSSEGAIPKRCHIPRFRLRFIPVIVALQHSSFISITLSRDPESQTSLVSQMDGPCNSGLGRPGVLPQHPLRISSRVQRLGSDLEALWLLQGKGL